MPEITFALDRLVGANAHELPAYGADKRRAYLVKPALMANRARSFGAEAVKVSGSGLPSRRAAGAPLVTVAFSPRSQRVVGGRW